MDPGGWGIRFPNEWTSFEVVKLNIGTGSVAFVNCSRSRVKASILAQILHYGKEGAGYRHKRLMSNVGYVTHLAFHGVICFPGAPPCGQMNTGHPRGGSEPIGWTADGGAGAGEGEPTRGANREASRN